MQSYDCNGSNNMSDFLFDKTSDTSVDMSDAAVRVHCLNQQHFRLRNNNEKFGDGSFHDSDMSSQMYWCPCDSCNCVANMKDVGSVINNSYFGDTDYKVVFNYKIRSKSERLDICSCSDVQKYKEFSKTVKYLKGCDNVIHDVCTSCMEPCKEQEQNSNFLPSKDQIKHINESLKHCCLDKTPQCYTHDKRSNFSNSEALCKQNGTKIVNGTLSLNLLIVLLSITLCLFVPTIRCETDIDECASLPCQNNATCINGNNTYECNCTEEYVGNQCQVKVSYSFQ